MRLLLPLILALPFALWPRDAAAQSPGVLVIGDSIACASVAALHARGFAVNAQVGRQWASTYGASWADPCGGDAPGQWHEVESGLTVARGLRAAGLLPRTVVVELGTNGPVSRAEVTAMRSLLSGRRVLVVLNYCAPASRSWSQCADWTGSNNALFWHSHFTADVGLILWSRWARQHQWTLVDGVHPGLAGQVALAALIAQGRLKTLFSHNSLISHPREETLSAPNTSNPAKKAKKARMV